MAGQGLVQDAFLRLPPPVAEIFGTCFHSPSLASGPRTANGMRGWSETTVGDSREQDPQVYIKSWVKAMARMGID